MSTMIRLDYGIRLELDATGQPIKVHSAEGEKYYWSYTVTKVLRFRHWFRRWCVGDLELCNDDTHSTRMLYFINAHPIFGFRFAWDSKHTLWRPLFNFERLSGR